MSSESAEFSASLTSTAGGKVAVRVHSPVGDRIFAGLISGAAWLVLIVVAALCIELTLAARPALLSLGFHPLASQTWDPNSGRFGILSFVYGTIVTSLLALLVATPVGIGIALFLAELAPRWMADPVGMLVELLAAVPSVVYGLWGLFVLAPLLRQFGEPVLSKTLGFLPLFSGNYYGVGLLAGGLILAIMVLPTVAAISRDVFNAVPNDQREAMLALGATKWETMTKAVVPYARSGLVGAVVLALGRALGEAMAVVMVIGNKPAISASLFAPSYTMASVLANEFTEATGRQYLAVLIEIGLLLFAVSIVVNVVARFMVWKVAGGRRVGT